MWKADNGAETGDVAGVFFCYLEKSVGPLHRTEAKGEKVQADNDSVCEAAATLTDTDVSFYTRQEYHRIISHALGMGTAPRLGNTKPYGVDVPKTTESLDT